MSVAFFNHHLRGLAEYSPYLTAAYTKNISQERDINLYLTQSLQPEQLEIAYGKKPPFPLLPNPVAIAKASREESILEEAHRSLISSRVIATI